MNMGRWAEGGLLAGLVLLLFCFPGESAQGARQGLLLCRDLLIPALFPFFVLSSLLIETGWAGRLVRPLARWARPLLGVGGAGTTALLLGLIGGYPVGLRTLASLRQRGDCSQAEARRAALFCNNCGPAFFIGAAGAGVFGSREAGFLLLGANLLAVLVLALGLRLLGGSVPAGRATVETKAVPLAEAFPGCVSSAFTSVLGVCGYVVLFSVLAALARRAGVLGGLQQVLCLLFPGSRGETLARALTLGLLELSTGTAALKEAAGCAAALPLASFLLGWGGLSVHGQSLPFLAQAGGRTRTYLAAKAVQGLLAAGITRLLLVVVPLSLPAMASLGPLLSPPLPCRVLTVLWLWMGGTFFLWGRKRGGNGRQNRV